MPKPCRTCTTHDQAIGPVPDPPTPPPAAEWSGRLSAGHAAAFAVAATPAADAPPKPAARRRAGHTDQE